MGTILTTLGDLGYWYAWRVLDAQFFGVPQRRRRVFIVGRLGLTGAAPGEILFEPESGSGNPAEGRASGAGASPGVVVSTLQGGGRRGYRIDAEAAAGGHLIPALTACKNGHRYDDQQSMQLVTTIGGNVTHTLRSEGADASEDGTGRGTPIIAGAAAVRRLTPMECERLQGFPDDWTATSNGKAQSDSARYRQTGNAVAVPVVTWIARRLAGAVAEVAA